MLTTDFGFIAHKSLEIGNRNRLKEGDLNDALANQMSFVRAGYGRITVPNL